MIVTVASKLSLVVLRLMCAMNCQQLSHSQHSRLQNRNHYCDLVSFHTTIAEIAQVTSWNRTWPIDLSRIWILMGMTSNHSMASVVHIHTTSDLLVWNFLHRFRSLENTINELEIEQLWCTCLQSSIPNRQYVQWLRQQQKIWNEKTVQNTRMYKEGIFGFFVFILVVGE